MKICPRCQKTYADDSLNFCLEDGSVLTQASTQPPPTMINQAPVTQQQMPMQSQPGSQPAWNTAPQQYSMQPPKKSSKTWIWVLLILGVLGILCGGGIGGLIYIGSQADRTTTTAVSNSNSAKSPGPSTNANKPTANTTTGSTTNRTDVDTVDISKWVKEFSVYGTTEFTDGELIMGSKQKGYYYALAAPDDYTTENADTKVTLRNIDDAASSLGYGLVFHSNPTPLQQGYAFLIDTKRKKYRVVHHTPQNESSVVAWTTSAAIKPGKEENTLEVHDLDDKIELYINGTMVTSIKNVYGYSGGVPGLYAGDGVKIAFKNLEIRK
ncbi:MAG: family 16 glycoside hydrolase [Pyrinomonadaceae bacterium]